MNELNDSRFEYLNEFYDSPSATYYPIYIWTVSSFVIVSDLFFILMTLTTRYLRKHKANFLLVGFCLADMLHCTAHLIDAYAIWTGSIYNRGLCDIAGTLVILTASCRLGFPALIAINRYYKISEMPGQSRTLLQKVFSESNIIPLVIGWYCIAYLINSPLIITDSFGEDEAGFCGAKKFTSVPLLISYEFSVIVVFAGGVILTTIYYYRLAKWLQQNQSVSNRESVAYTRSLMLVMKFETLIPLIGELPTAILTAGQMVLPYSPMWVKRLLVAPYWFASCANPWLTISLVRPFRRRFTELLKTAKATTLHEIELRNTSTRRTTVQEFR